MLLSLSSLLAIVIVIVIVIVDIVAQVSEAVVTVDGRFFAMDGSRVFRKWRGAARQVHRHVFVRSDRIYRDDTSVAVH